MEQRSVNGRNTIELKMCCCADPEGCKVTIPGYICKRQYVSIADFLYLNPTDQEELDAQNELHPGV